MSADIYHSSNPHNTELSSSDSESVASNSMNNLKSPVESITSLSEKEPSILTNSNVLLLPISRPLSRTSITSGVSVTATKDGIEGKSIKRAGIPSYPLSLINKMYSNTKKQQLKGNQLEQSSNNYTTTPELGTDVDDGASVLSLSSMIPQYSPEPGERATNDQDSIIDQVSQSNTTQSHLNEVLNYKGSMHNGSDEESLDDYSKFLKRTS